MKKRRKFDEYEELERQYVEKFGHYPNTYAVCGDLVDAVRKAIETGVEIGANIPKDAVI